MLANPVPDLDPHWQLWTWVCSSLWGAAAALVCYWLLERVAELQLEKRVYKVRVPLFFKLFLPIARRLEKQMRHRAFASTIARTDARLVMAGLDQTFTPEEFVAIRLVYLAIFVPVGMLLLGLPSGILALLGLLLVIFGLGYPWLWLSGIIKARHRAIQRALPSVLDLLTLSVEAGRDFLSALREILQHREPDPLSEELERVFREVQLGKQRRQALRAMADRCRQPDLSSVVETLVQADELGVSIGHILRILGDQMRQKRFAHAEKIANEAPVKLLFPLFIFIFPAVIIVMLGPVLLRSLSGFLH